MTCFDATFVKLFGIVARPAPGRGAVRRDVLTQCSPSRHDQRSSPS
jgi:hypothetical protein